MTATTETIKDLDRAIKRFGTYQLEDKGAVEVMDVDAIEARLRRAGVQTAIETLRALSAHEHGEPLIRHLIMTFVEDEPGWDQLVDALEADAELHRAYVPWLGDAPDCTKCGASNAGSREAPFECDVCDPSLRIHKAEPQNRGQRLSCAACGQPVHLVPGGHGPTYVHSDSGAVAAPNPPVVGGRPLSKWGIPGITDDEIARINAALEDQ